MVFVAALLFLSLRKRHSSFCPQNLNMSIMLNCLSQKSLTSLDYFTILLKDCSIRCAKPMSQKSTPWRVDHIPLVTKGLVANFSILLPIGFEKVPKPSLKDNFMVSFYFQFLILLFCFNFCKHFSVHITFFKCGNKFKFQNMFVKSMKLF